MNNNIYERIGKLYIITPEKCSGLGNPRYRCFLIMEDDEGVEVYTRQNSGISYEIKKYERKRVKVKVRFIRDKYYINDIELAEKCLGEQL